MWFKNRRAKWRKTKREEEARKRAIESGSGSSQPEGDILSEGEMAKVKEEDDNDSSLGQEEISVTDDEDDERSASDSLRNSLGSEPPAVTCHTSAEVPMTSRVPAAVPTLSPTGSGDLENSPYWLLSVSRVVWTQWLNAHLMSVVSSNIL